MLGSWLNMHGIILSQYSGTKFNTSNNVLFVNDIANYKEKIIRYTEIFSIALFCPCCANLISFDPAGGTMNIYITTGKIAAVMILYAMMDMV